MNNVSVRLVFDRKHVATKKHQASVQMEITYQRKRKYIGTGININRKTFCSAFPNHFVSILHLLTQNELWFFHSFSNNF